VRIAEAPAVELALIVSSTSHSHLCPLPRCCHQQRLLGPQEEIPSQVDFERHLCALAILCVLSIISLICFPTDLTISYPPKTALWHAYVVFLVVLTGFTAFSKDKHTHSASLATKVMGVIALIFLTSTSIGYAFESQKGDVAGAAVIAWELLAIYISEFCLHMTIPSEFHLYCGLNLT
jgi:hypothetical protein